MDPDIIVDEHESTNEVANIQPENNPPEEDSNGPSERHSSHSSFRPLDLSDRSVSEESLPLPSTSVERESSIDRIEAIDPRPSSTQPSPSPDESSPRKTIEPISISAEED